MGKVLLVIGASSDIGISLIEGVCGEYEHIIAHYNHMNEGLKKLDKQFGNKMSLVQADLSDDSGIDRLIADIKNIANPTHIVHFPAPQCKNSKFNKISWDTFQNEINISLKSIIRILQEFLPTMAKMHSGKVVVMLSYVVNNVAPAYCSNYVVIKYAMLGLVKALATEYANKGITVNGVSPAWVETKYIDNQPDILVNQNIESSPIGRLLKPKDIIPSVRLLLSDGGNCINGQNITISCGR